MNTMRKKIFVLFVAFVLLFSLTACGGSGDSDKETADKSEETLNVLVSGEDIQEYDEGSGPVIIESRFGSITIPEGLDYMLYTDSSKEGSTSIQVHFGKGNTDSGSITVDDHRLVSSMDDVVEACFWVNGYDVDPVVGKDVTYGDITYKSITIEDPKINGIVHYLASYYKTKEGKDGYIEIAANGTEGFATIDVDDPLIVEMLEKLVLK